MQEFAFYCTLQSHGLVLFHYYCMIQYHLFSGHKAEVQCSYFTLRSSFFADVFWWVRCVPAAPEPQWLDTSCPGAPPRPSDQQWPVQWVGNQKPDSAESSSCMLQRLCSQPPRWSTKVQKYKIVKITQ